MNRLLHRLRPRQRDERGVALMTVMLVMALVSALTLTICVIATNNLVSARLAQQAGAAVNASDAGVAQAVTYLRRKGVSKINACWNSDGTQAAACATSWGKSASPTTVTIGGKAAQSYNVWIKPIAPFPANKPGVYRVTATGVAGGPAGRTVTTDVYVNPLPFVFGIVAASVDGGGNAGVHHESIFSTGCVTGRSKIAFDGLDVAYGIPAAVHTSGLISTKNGNGSCSGQLIHDSDPCNTTYPYDQDSLGATLPTTSTCYNKARSVYGNLAQFNDTNSVAYNYPRTSYIDEATMASKFMAKRRPFTDAQLAQLKATAQSDGTYYTSTTFTVPSGPDALLYFDLTSTNPGGTVDLNDLAVSPWNRDHDPATCPSQSLMVIIEGGNARMNSNSKLSAAVFLVSGDPYGNVSKANGTATFTGTLYANNVDLTGTADMWMDQCFMNNIPPALTSMETRNYREVDR